MRGHAVLASSAPGRCHVCAWTLPYFVCCAKYERRAVPPLLQRLIESMGQPRPGRKHPPTPNGPTGIADGIAARCEPFEWVTVESASTASSPIDPPEPERATPMGDRPNTTRAPAPAPAAARPAPKHRDADGSRSLPMCALCSAHTSHSDSFEHLPLFPKMHTLNKSLGFAALAAKSNRLGCATAPATRARSSARRSRRVRACVPSDEHAPSADPAARASAAWLAKRECAQVRMGLSGKPDLRLAGRAKAGPCRLTSPMCLSLSICLLRIDR